MIPFTAFNTKITKFRQKRNFAHVKGGKGRGPIVTAPYFQNANVGPAQDYPMMKVYFFSAQTLQIDKMCVAL